MRLLILSFTTLFLLGCSPSSTESTSESTSPNADDAPIEKIVLSPTQGVQTSPNEAWSRLEYTKDTVEESQDPWEIIFSDKNDTDKNPETTSKKTEVTIGNKVYEVEIADTKTKREQGLMYRTDLALNQGMLFKFENSAKHRFWMKNTPLPLDIIWLNDRREVVDYLTAEPCKTDPCDIFTPVAKAKYVIELNADEFRGYIGDKIEF